MAVPGPLYPSAMIEVQRRKPIGTWTVLAVLGLAACAGGCARNSVEIGVTTRAETYEGFGDPMELATADPSRMAVLPTLTFGGGGDRADAANMAMGEALDYDYRPFTLLTQDEKNDITAIRFDQVVNRCIANDETGTLETVMSSLRKDGIPDHEATLRLGELLQVDYLLVPKLVSIKVDNAGRFTFTGLTFIRTGWISIEASMQLWDVPTGELVWQSTGEGSLTAENVVGISPPVQSALDGIMVTLFGDFVTGRSEAVVRTTVEKKTASSDPGGSPPPVAPPTTSTGPGTPSATAAPPASDSPDDTEGS